jgi:acyl phosphate:glycerol-3-phosphate acyltransferase
MLWIILLGFLVGAIPFAVLVGRAASDVDVRHRGSGNTGAMNTFRSVGPVAGALVAVLDAAKGVLFVVLGTWLFDPRVGAFAGCAAVVGHCFSPYLIAAGWRDMRHHWKLALRRSGGKGLATGVGVLLAMAWPAVVVGAVAFAITYAIQRRDVTVPSVVGTLAAVPAMYVVTGDIWIGLAALIVALVMTIKHLPDLRTGFWVEAPNI